MVQIGQHGHGGLPVSHGGAAGYTDVTKAVFGLEIKPQDGWTIKKVESLNTNTSLDIVFNVPEGTNGKEVMKSYFEACAALSSSIWESKINSETYQTVKGAQFADFDAFFDAEGSDTGTMTQGEWIYEFGDNKPGTSQNGDTSLTLRSGECCIWFPTDSWN